MGLLAGVPQTTTQRRMSFLLPLRLLFPYTLVFIVEAQNHILTICFKLTIHFHAIHKQNNNNTKHTHTTSTNPTFPEATALRRMSWKSVLSVTTYKALSPRLTQLSLTAEVRDGRTCIRIPILQTRERKAGTVKPLSHGHTNPKWQSYYLSSNVWPLNRWRFPWTTPPLLKHWDPHPRRAFLAVMSNHETSEKVIFLPSSSFSSLSSSHHP